MTHSEFTQSNLISIFASVFGIIKYLLTHASHAQNDQFFVSSLSIYHSSLFVFHFLFLCSSIVIWMHFAWSKFEMESQMRLVDDGDEQNWKFTFKYVYNVEFHFLFTSKSGFRQSLDAKFFSLFTWIFRKMFYACVLVF